MSKTERGDVMMEADVEGMILLALEMEKGARAKECGPPLDAGKARTRIPASSFQRNVAPRTHLQ